MPALPHDVEAILPWAGLGLLSLIFLANALGVLDQSVATRELAATGVPGPLARLAIGSGRALQLIAAPCLFFPFTRPYAAIALTVFLAGATATAHAFWKAPPPDRDRQVANFLKNTAIVGALLLVAGWRQ
jgi:uncharacterized membrane protein YphA (DoxX/SURF4 family)